jgi:hypothetical protein
MYMNSAWFYFLVGTHNCNLCREDCTEYYKAMLGKVNGGIREEFCGSILRHGPMNIDLWIQSLKVR